MTAVDQALAEVRAKLAEYAPIREGLDDYLHLDILDPARAEVTVLLADYDRRIQKLQAAEAALVDLLADGHPTIAKKEIAGTAFTDLKDQKTTISAALDQFSVITAVTLGLQGGEAENK